MSVGARGSARGDRMASTRSRIRKGDKADVATEGGALGYDDAVLIDFYKKMVQLRLFEDAAQRGFRTGQIGGYLHL